MTETPQRWSLEGLVPTPGTPEFVAFETEVNQWLADFEAARPDLTPDINLETFGDLVRRYERIYEAMMRLYAYAYLRFATDTRDQDAVAFRAQAEQRFAEVQNRLLFFDLWWKMLDDATAERLYPATGDARYHFESLRRFKPHTLSEAEERIINIKNVNGPQALNTLYDIITAGFRYRLTVNGETKTMTRGELMSYAFNPNPDLRAAAYQELFRLYGDHAPALAQIYAARVRDWGVENVKLRGFAQPISPRNLENNIPDAAVETLLQVVRQNVGLFQRYFRLKARLLGMERLRRYDIYAPLSEVEKTYTYDEALRIVDESYRAFSPTLADLARRVVEDRRLDAETRPGKLDGAFCYGVYPGSTPWVLVNYTGQLREVSTLAHELGHAVHALMAAEHSPLTFHSALPMAETASVFGEMLLSDNLLKQESDPKVRQSLLASILDEAYATISRQAYFVYFEQLAHQMLQEGATPDQLNARYLDTLREQFGDAVDLSDDFRLEWLAIPHIYHTPFYCYAYAFGNLLVLALYRKYRELGRAFEPTYLRILAYGGSASPAHIVGEAGFDITQASFWQGGFDLLAEFLDELERIV